MRKSYAKWRRSLDLERQADELLKPKVKPTDRSIGKTTSAHVDSCNCKVLPWEDCEHTSQPQAEIRVMRFDGSLFDGF